MSRLDVDGRFFEIAFRHVRFERGPAHELKPNEPARAITTCALIAINPDPDENIPDLLIQFVAIGNAICKPEDTFSRRKGRHTALYNAVNHCGALRDSKTALLAAYAQLDPDPPPLQRVRPKLDEAIKKARWEAGWEKRQARMAARYQDSGKARLAGTQYAPRTAV